MVLARLNTIWYGAGKHDPLQAGGKAFHFGMTSGHAQVPMARRIYRMREAVRDLLVLCSLHISVYHTCLPLLAETKSDYRTLIAPSSIWHLNTVLGDLRYLGA